MGDVICITETIAQCSKCLAFCDNSTDQINYVCTALGELYTHKDYIKETTGTLQFDVRLRSYQDYGAVLTGKYQWIIKRDSKPDQVDA